MRKLLSVAIVLTFAVAIGAQTKCTFNPTGKSCGPRLGGSERVANGTHIVTLTVSKAPITAQGLLAIGVQPLLFQFPGTDCYLHLNPLLVVGINSDGNGNAVRTFARHEDLMGTVLVQAGFEDLRRNQPLATSNALKITCQ